MVASEYAKAIYELALEENKLDIFKENFDVVTSSLKDKDFVNVLSSPFVNAKEKKNILEKIYESLDKTFINFLKVILDHNRISIFTDIYDLYNKMILEKKDIIKIQVFSAIKLSNMQLIHLTEALQKKYYGKKIELENILDSDLIGGIHIVSNGESIDISLKNSLNKLKEIL